MKTIKKTSTKTKHIVLVSIIACLVLGSAAYVYAQGRNRDSAEIKDRGPSATDLKTEESTNADAKKEFVEQNPDQSTPGVIVPIPDSNDSITISVQQKNGIASISTRLAGYASGNCDLTISANQKVIKKSAQIIYQPEFSTCAGFDVVTSELGSGTWSIRLDATPADGSTITKEIRFEA